MTRQSRAALSRCRTRSVSIVLLAAMPACIPAFAPAPRAFAQGARAPALASLLLSTSDIQRVYGPGFKSVLARRTDNADVSAVAPGTAGQGERQALLGRVSGYVAMYSRQLISFKGKKITAKPGVTLVLMGVNQYKSAGAAHLTITAAEQGKPKMPKGTSARSVPLSGVGEAAVMLLVHSAVSGIPTTNSTYIGFQRGKYSAVIDVAAYGGQPNAGTVLSLARLFDARIRTRG